MTLFTKDSFDILVTKHTIWEKIGSNFRQKVHKSQCRIFSDHNAEKKVDCLNNLLLWRAYKILHLYFTNLLDNKILMIMCVPCKFINQLSHVEVRVVAAKLQITIGCCHKRRKFTLNYKLAWKRNKLLCQTFLNIEDIKNPWWDIKERRRAGVRSC